MDQEGGDSGPAMARVDLKPGAHVILHGLQQKEAMNGLHGTLVNFDMESGRWKVKVGNDWFNAKESKLLLVGSVTAYTLARRACYRTFQDNMELEVRNEMRRSGAQAFKTDVTAQ
eukprot:4432560-Karenia_brevis.AAC.1